MELVYSNGLQIAQIVQHKKLEIDMKREEKIKKLAEEFLWSNAGDSFGCYGGGKRAFKKMPWCKLMQGKKQ